MPLYPQCRRRLTLRMSVRFHGYAAPVHCVLRGWLSVEYGMYSSMTNASLFSSARPRLDDEVIPASHRNVALGQLLETR